MNSSPPKTPEQLQQATRRARKTANRKALFSAAGGAIPLPGLDFLVDFALIQKVTGEINHSFGLTPAQIEKFDAETKLKVADILLKLSEKGVASLVGKHATHELVKKLLMRMGSKSAGKSAAKLVPIIGSVVSAGLSFSIMKMMCEMHIKDCQRVVEASWKGLSEEASDTKIETAPPPLPEP